MSQGRRPRLAAALVLALGFALLPMPSTHACEPSLVACSVDHDDTDVAMASTKHIGVVAPLRTDNGGLSSTLYRSLVPSQYAMPDQPLVGVVLRQLQVPRSQVPGSTWVDGTIALRVEVDGEGAWYPISAPTTSAQAYADGRAAGFPRYLSTGSFAATASGWRATTAVDGRPSLTLEWAPQRTAPVPGDAVDLTTLRSPSVGLLPALQGPTRTRQKVTAKPAVPLFDPVGGAPLQELAVRGVTALAPVEKGQVRLAVDGDLNELDSASPAALPDLPFGQDRSLGDVIALDQTLPGLFWQTEALLITQTDNLDDGRDGPLSDVPDLPAAQGLVVAPTAAAAVGFAPRALVLSHGSALSLLNLDDTVHDVMCDAVDRTTGQPLCRSSYAQPREVGAVAGVDKLPRGLHTLHCSLHGQMELTLLIR